MLKILFRETENVQPVHSELPWLDFVTPNLILCKDGSLLAGFSFSGIDPYDLYEEKLDSIVDQLENAYLQFDSRITAWWIADKRRDYSYLEGDFNNPVAKVIDDLHGQSFRDGSHFSISKTLYLLFTESSGVGSFFDKVQRIQSEEKNSNFLGALLGAMKESLSGKEAFFRDINALNNNVETFNRILAAFENAVPIDLKPLSKNVDFESALANLLNRASENINYQKPDGSLLDSSLPVDYISSGDDVIRFKGNSSTKYAASLGIKKWAPLSTPLLFEIVLKLDMELTLCQIMRFLNNEETNKEINKANEYYKLTQFGILNQAISRLAGSEAKPKAGKQRLLEEIEEISDDVNSAGHNHLYHALNLFVYGQTVGELNKNIKIADQKLNIRKFGTVRERMNTLPSFFSMMPGQWSRQSRYELNGIDYAANCSPIFGIDEGSVHHEFFSKVIYGKLVPKFTTFGNIYGGRINFAPHVDQVGHLVIIAPTGGGKSTFVNFCLSQFQRYGRVKTIIFDRKNSCKITTELHGGSYLDLKSGSGLLCNPCLPLMNDSADGLVFVREWISRRIEEGGYTLSAEDRNEIDNALISVKADYQRNLIPITLSTIAVSLPSALVEQLGEWLKGRPFGMFDSVDDCLNFSDWSGIELKEIMAHDRLARAFMDHAFYQTYSKLDGTPTFIYLEEASFLFNDDRFARMIEDWLKTLRSKNAFVWMTIQSPTSITNKDISAALLDNVFSFLLLHNDKAEAHREAYIKNFAFQDHHVDLIKQLKPRKEYLLIQNNVPKILQTNFSNDLLAYLRGEEVLLKLFEDHRQSGFPDWKERYIKEVQSGRR